MATPFKNLSALLTNRPDMSLRPSPERSALIQQLMARSMQPQGAQTPIEGLNIAAKPIIAALLARRERQGQENQRRLYSSLANALSLSSQEGAAGDSSRRAALAIAGQLPGNPLSNAVLGAQAQQAFAPEGVQRRPAATDIGKINQDRDSGIISPDTADFLTRAARNEDARSISDAETSLRGEFQDNVRGFASGIASLQNARNLLALEDNPIGAQAALTAFVRAIDNSVVRPSEQAQYQNVFGVAQSLENRIGQLLGEGAFTEESKQEILEAVDALAAGTETLMDKAASYYNDLAVSANLDPYHVTGFDFSDRGQASGKAEIPDRDTSTEGEPTRTIL